MTAKVKGIKEEFNTSMNFFFHMTSVSNVKTIIRKERTEATCLRQKYIHGLKGRSSSRSCG